jgi:anti-sigma factor RsiW
MIRWLRRPKGMSCQEVAEVLQQYLDREIEPGLARRVTVHVEACDLCAVEVHLFTEIKSELARKGDERVDPAVLDSLQRFCRDLLTGPPPASDG